MATQTKIAEDVHMVKLRVSSDASYSVSVPKELAAEAGMCGGVNYVTVRRVGPCIVIALAKYAIPDDAKRESDANVERAIEEWQMRFTGPERRKEKRS